MLGAFVDGLFKGLEFHEKLYDVKQKKLLSRAADEYLNGKKDGDTRAPLPAGRKLGSGAGQGGGMTGGGDGSAPAGAGSDTPQTNSQTRSASAADEPQAAPAPKPESQKLKEQALGSPPEGDIGLGRGYTGLPVQPVPAGPALAFDASQNMGNPVPMRPSTGLFRPSTVADAPPPPGYLGQVANRYFASPLGSGLAGLGQVPATISGGMTALGDFGNQALRGLLPRQPGSTLVNPDYDDPDKRPY